MRDSMYDDQAEQEEGLPDGLEESSDRVSYRAATLNTHMVGFPYHWERTVGVFDIMMSKRSSRK